MSWYSYVARELSNHLFAEVTRRRDCRYSQSGDDSHGGKLTMNRKLVYLLWFALWAMFAFVVSGCHLLQPDGEKHWPQSTYEPE